MRRVAFALIAVLAAGAAAGCADDPPAAGELLEEELLAGEREVGGADVVRIRYGSIDVSGEPSEVTGVVAVPPGQPPEGGWPVVAFAHGTTGAADRCAPSLDPALGAVGPSLEALALAGYVAVATDYEGLGTPGPHPYLHGPSAARAVVDGVRAARALVPVADDRWAVVGHSQGGHAALFAAELAGELAPELELVGAVALAPATDLADLVAAGSPQRELLAVLLGVGILAVNPDAEPEDLLTAEGADAVKAAERQCGLIPAPDRVLRRDAPAVVEYLQANTAGQVAPPVPLLVLQGRDDELTTPAATEAAVARLCDLGATVALRTYPRTDHATIVAAGADATGAWLAERFAGRPAPSSC